MANQAPRRYCPLCGKLEHGNIACNAVSVNIGSHWDTCWRDGEAGDRHHTGCAISHYKDLAGQLAEALQEARDWNNAITPKVANALAVYEALKERT